MWAFLRRRTLTQWILVAMVVGTLAGLGGAGIRRQSPAALDHLPADDQVADRAADLRHAGHRHRRARRRHEARRPARPQVADLLRDRHHAGAVHRAAGGQHHQARASACDCRRRDRHAGSELASKHATLDERPRAHRAAERLRGGREERSAADRLLVDPLRRGAVAGPRQAQGGHARASAKPWRK